MSAALCTRIQALLIMAITETLVIQLKIEISDRFLFAVGKYFFATGKLKRGIFRMAALC